MTSSPFAPGSTLADVGEHALLRMIKDKIFSDALLGIGDDAAVVAAPDGRVVISTDVLTADRHFKLNWSSAEQVGGRVAAANLADIAAMGAQPTGLVVAMVMPAATEVAWALGFLDGMVAECDRAGAKVVGGDLSGGDAITATATAIGDLGGRDPVTRSGAVDGNVVAVAGRLGWSAAGLAVLLKGFSSPRAVVDAFRMPQPPYAAGIAASEAGARAMIDVSDGLLADLGHIAAASGVTIDIDSGLLVIDDPVAQAAAAFTVDPLEWVLGGGEDHSLAAVFDSEDDVPDEFRIVGRVVGAGDSPVLVDGEEPAVPRGFDHFQCA